MKQRSAFVALALLALAAPAAAEPQRLAQATERGVLPPDEVIEILRDGGFDPLTQPLRRGANYVLRAVDDTDREVRVVVGARSGEIVAVTPVATASRMPPGGRVAPYEPVQPAMPGYVPPAPPGTYRGAVIIDDDDEPLARPPAPVPGGPSGYGAVPNGPTSAPAETPAQGSRPLRSTAIPPPAGDRTGLLPPPPERFQRHATPAPSPAAAAKPKPVNPKPVKRTAVALPKTAPLPKPRPGGGSAPAATPAAPAEAAPPQAAPAAAPTEVPSPAAADVPN